MQARLIRSFAEAHNVRKLLLLGCSHRAAQLAPLLPTLSKHGILATMCADGYSLESGDHQGLIAVVEPSGGKHGIADLVTPAWITSLPTVVCAAEPASPVCSPGSQQQLVFPGSVFEVLQGLLGYPRALEVPGLLGFADYAISEEQVFWRSPLSFAIVNIKPVLPGHVLVLSRRRVPRFGMLAAEEVADLWQTAQVVCEIVKAAHAGSTSATFAMQDGAAAGQTVPHVHVHVVPRRPADLVENDQIYDLVEENEAAIGSLFRAEGSGGTPKAAAVAAALEARPHRQHTAIAVDPLTPAAALMPDGELSILTRTDAAASATRASVGEAIFPAEPAESSSTAPRGAGSSSGDSSSGTCGQAVTGGKQTIPPPQHRRVRSRDEMAAEAQVYRETAERMRLLPVA